jgi:hypothetical protein
MAMKKLLTLVLILAASVASAGTYTLTTTAAQDTRLERQRVRVNKQTCERLGLPGTCTQAQARNVETGVDVYSNVQDFLDRNVLKSYLASLKGADTADDAAQAAALWVIKTDTDKNAVCTLMGLPAGCEIWPR